MRSVGIKSLKDRLSEYVRLAEQGEVVLITDRGRVVAELAPPREARSAMIVDTQLADLVRNGFLTPALHPPGQIPATAAVSNLNHLLADLASDREDR